MYPLHYSASASWSVPGVGCMTSVSVAASAAAWHGCWPECWHECWACASHKHTRRTTLPCTVQDCCYKLAEPFCFAKSSSNAYCVSLLSLSRVLYHPTTPPTATSWPGQTATSTALVPFLTRMHVLAVCTWPWPPGTVCQPRVWT